MRRAQNYCFNPTCYEGPVKSNVQANQQQPNRLGRPIAVWILPKVSNYRECLNAKDCLLYQIKLEKGHSAMLHWLCKGF